MAFTYGSFVTQEGGMNGAFDSAIISENQYAKGINLICRRGIISTRPSFNFTDLEFEYDYDEQHFLTGKFQGAEYYTFGGKTYIVCAVSGWVYLVDPDTRLTRNLSFMSSAMNQYRDRLFFCQAEDDMIVQDGYNAPMIISGSSARISKPGGDDKEVPAGTIMAYGQHRLFVKIAPRAFIAGDIAKVNDPEAHLKFTENLYFGQGGAFLLKASLGEITGMTFASNYDSSTGDGPLMVFAENGVSSYAVNVSRTLWGTTDIGKIQLQGVGLTGPLALTKVNEDIMFRSWSGIESYLLLQQQATSAHRYSGMSNEINPLLDQDTDWILPLASATHFDNRLLMTVVGQKVRALDTRGEEVEDYCFRGIAPLDFEQSNILSRPQSSYRSGSWDGVWTGIRPTAIVSGLFSKDERCFVFGKDVNNQNRLYEIGKVTGYDNHKYGSNKIQSRHYTKTYVAKIPDNEAGTPFIRKKYEKARLWIKKFSETVPIKLWLRTDNVLGYKFLAETLVRAPVECCGDPDGIPEVGGPQARPGMLFPSPVDVCDAVGGKSILLGYEFQFCLEWEGYLEYSRFVFTAIVTAEDPYVLCPEPEDTAKKNTEKPRSDFDYVITGGIAA